MSMKIPYEYRNTHSKKMKLKCLTCKNLMWTENYNNKVSKWLCHINGWVTGYDKENHECEYYKKDLERVKEIRVCKNPDCIRRFRKIDEDQEYCKRCQRKGLDE